MVDMLLNVNNRAVCTAHCIVVDPNLGAVVQVVGELVGYGSVIVPHVCAKIRAETKNGRKPPFLKLANFWCEPNGWRNDLWLRN
jgi:hypothetical protein